MQRNRCCFIALIFVIVLTITGCGNNQDLVNENSKLKQENRELKQSVSDLNTKIASLQQQLPAESLAIANSTSAPVEALNLRCWDDIITNFSITFHNLSTKTIDAISFSVLFFDNFGKPVGSFSSDDDNVSSDGLFQEIIAPNATASNSWQTYGFDNAKKIKVVISEVHFTDNTIWINEDAAAQIEDQQKQY
ncbi:MAG: DUF5780 domain-containing protein [Syntrophomonadaceae bacterium]|nr:DUF5780 domain-containing protein [Syntrophomonadaceae bacterium]HPR94116.1 DUF5780 domain-containing protein [Syntrophomonadaceae bacterium]